MLKDPKLGSNPFSNTGHDRGHIAPRDAFSWHVCGNYQTFFGNSSGLPRPAYIQNTFGASLGGPIRHDRTFIFGNYQGRRNAQQVVRNRLVLTPEAKAGLFRWKTLGSSEIQTFDIVGNDPRGIGIDPIVAQILKLLPDPNNYDIGDKFRTPDMVSQIPEK